MSSDLWRLFCFRGAEKECYHSPGRYSVPTEQPRDIVEGAQYPEVFTVFDEL